mmetsp:Transcript_101107/g.179459  ORF Transcript_101107/g.179459 Transcript_101107/m.179459 type:complete len:219 (+) Transcript_101107:1397-2053(+)
MDKAHHHFGQTARIFTEIMPMRQHVIVQVVPNVRDLAWIKGDIGVIMETLFVVLHLHESIKKLAPSVLFPSQVKPLSLEGILHVERDHGIWHTLPTDVTKRNCIICSIILLQILCRNAMVALHLLKSPFLGSGNALYVFPCQVLDCVQKLQRASNLLRSFSQPRVCSWARPINHSVAAQVIITHKETFDGPLHRISDLLRDGLVEQALSIAVSSDQGD